MTTKPLPPELLKRWQEFRAEAKLGVNAPLIARLARAYIMIREDPKSTRAAEHDAYERLREACERLPA